MSHQECVSGLQVLLGGELVTVGEKCDQDLGNWACITHQVMFLNQAQMQHHAESGNDHLVAWACHHHGLEQP